MVPGFSAIVCLLMDQQNRNKGRMWKVIFWNIRGINSSSKWNSIRNKIQETTCDILCIQETKREFFDLAYIKKICPPSFDSFGFVPSKGILTV
jgi:exonuclease III